jgi:hypothetical protein
LAAAQPELTERLAKELLALNGTLPESPIEAVAGKNNWNWPRESQ